MPTPPAPPDPAPFAWPDDAEVDELFPDTVHTEQLRERAGVTHAELLHVTMVFDPGEDTVYGGLQAIADELEIVWAGKPRLGDMGFDLAAYVTRLRQRVHVLAELHRQQLEALVRSEYARDVARERLHLLLPPAESSK